MTQTIENGRKANPEPQERQHVIRDLLSSLSVAHSVWRIAVRKGIVRSCDKGIREGLYDECVKYLGFRDGDGNGNRDKGSISLATERQLSYFMDLCERKGVKPDTIARQYNTPIELIPRREMGLLIERLRCS